MESHHSNTGNKTFTIIGGGIAGLTVAIALKKIGIQATVFEAAPEFNTVGAGITLAYNAMKAFRHLGLYKEMEGVGRPISSFEICDEAGKMISRVDSNTSEKTTIFPIHRAELHQVLLSQLEDENLVNGKRISGFTNTNLGYELEFDDGTTHHTDYLIGDAAHAATPNMGQGACQAIEDAVILAGCVKEAQSVQEAFKNFEQKRMKRTHDIVKQSWNTGKIAQLENRFLSSIRNLLLRHVPVSVMEKQMEKLYEVEFSL